MSNVLSNLNFSGFAGVGSQIIYWLGVILFAVAFFGLVFWVYYYMGFPMRLTIFKLNGSLKGGYELGRIKRNKMKWNKDKTAWKTLFPLFNKKELKPFESDQAYAGNKIFGYEIAGEIKPLDISFDHEELKIKPVEYHIRQWQSLTHKKHAEEFAEHNFWQDNKQFFMTVLTALFCCALVGVTIYFTYKFATAGTGEIRSLAEAIRGLSNIPGKPAG